MTTTVTPDYRDKGFLMDAKVLNNNATYTSSTVLDAKATNLTVNVQNSGYRKTAN